jgi:hypothetical protein
MEEHNRLDELYNRLELLIRKQEKFNMEINELRREIFFFQQQNKNQRHPDLLTAKSKLPSSDREGGKRKFSAAEYRSNLEKFIGENLISKIGIVITVIGVVIGAKYSIEHQLISPLARIVLGYLLGAGLMGIGLHLKKDYKNYSAVLVSGAIAILYSLPILLMHFTTYSPNFWLLD